MEFADGDRAGVLGRAAFPQRAHEDIGQAGGVDFRDFPEQVPDPHLVVWRQEEPHFRVAVDFRHFPENLQNRGKFRFFLPSGEMVADPSAFAGAGNRQTVEKFLGGRCRMRAEEQRNRRQKCQAEEPGGET